MSVKVGGKKTTDDDVEDAPPLKILPYDLNYVPGDILKRAKTELFESEETRINSLQTLRTMLRTEEPDLNFYDNEMWLMAFLRSRKFDVKRAFNMMKTYYTIQKKHHEIFEVFDIKQFIYALEQDVVGSLPYRDPDGRVILVLRIENWSPYKLTWGQYTQTLTYLLLHGIKNTNTQIAGFHVIMDLKGLSLSQLPHVTPKYLWLIAEALQNCFPARFKGVHFINESNFFAPVWTVLRSFLSKKLADRFYFHGKNLSKFHKIFPPCVLPSNFGGKLPPFSNAHLIEKVKECPEYFEKLVTYGYERKEKRQS